MEALKKSIQAASKPSQKVATPVGAAGVLRLPKAEHGGREGRIAQCNETPRDCRARFAPKPLHVRRSPCDTGHTPISSHVSKGGNGQPLTRNTAAGVQTDYHLPIGDHLAGTARAAARHSERDCDGRLRLRYGRSCCPECGGGHTWLKRAPTNPSATKPICLPPIRARRIPKSSHCDDMLMVKTGCAC
jgi:hypothetical protein